MLKPAETARIHEALTMAQGDREAAAEVLGMTTADLGSAIRSHPDLALLWVNRQGDHQTADEAYDRAQRRISLSEPVDIGGAPELPDGVTPADKSRADAIDNQEQKLRKLDWEGLGVKDEKALSLMRRFEGFAGGGLNRTLDAMYGGMCYCFASVSARFEHAAAMLEDPAVKADENKYALWHTMYMDYAREMQRFNKEATNAGHTRLLIADKARKMQQAGNQIGKKRLRMAPAQQQQTTPR